MHTRLWIGLLPLLAPLASCGKAACPGFTRLPAIEVEVRRETTLVAEAAGAIAILTDGAYTDTMKADITLPNGDPLGFSGGFGREGVYDVLVQKPGFQDWTDTGVTSRSDACGIVPRRLYALLKPLP